MREMRILGQYLAEFTDTPLITTKVDIVPPHHLTNTILTNRITRLVDNQVVTLSETFKNRLNQHVADERYIFTPPPLIYIGEYEMRIIPITKETTHPYHTRMWEETEIRTEKNKHKKKLDTWIMKDVAIPIKIRQNNRAFFGIGMYAVPYLVEQLRLRPDLRSQLYGQLLISPEYANASISIQREGYSKDYEVTDCEIIIQVTPETVFIDLRYYTCYTITETFNYKPGESLVMFHTT